MTPIPLCPGHTIAQSSPNDVNVGSSAPFTLAPLLLLQLRQRTWMFDRLEDEPPRLAGMMWSPVRSWVDPHSEQNGCCAIATFASRYHSSVYPRRCRVGRSLCSR